MHFPASSSLPLCRGLWFHDRVSWEVCITFLSEHGFTSQSQTHPFTLTPAVKNSLLFYWSFLSDCWEEIPPFIPFWDLCWVTSWSALSGDPSPSGGDVLPKYQPQRPQSWKPGLSWVTKTSLYHSVQDMHRVCKLRSNSCILCIHPPNCHSLMSVELQMGVLMDVVHGVEYL